MTGRWIVLSLAAVVLCLGCTPAPLPEPEALRPLIYVSILPQHDLVLRLCGDQVEVGVLVGPGRSPTTYEPTPKQMAELQRAELYIRIGMPFEQTLLSKVARLMPELLIIDGRRGIELQPMSEQPGSGPDDHEHGEGQTGHHHLPGEPDPHFWLDPLLVKIHVNTVADALASHFAAEPELVAGLQRRRAALLAELDTVHARVGAILAPVAGRPLFVYHPAFGYPARRYGLHQVAVEVAGKEPSARQLGLLIKQAREAGARAVFIQPQLSDRSARVVAEAFGGEVVTLDPLAPDYLQNLELMAGRIARAYRP